MTPDRSPMFSRALALMCVLGLIAGCGDDGTGPGPGGNGGDPAASLGDFTSGMTEAGAFFANNGVAFFSLQTFAPFFQSGFSPSPPPGPGATSASLLLACIDPAVAGTTFEFDFMQSAYVAGTMTGAPTDGARFLLYQNEEARGHADVTCPGDLPVIDVTLAVVWDGVTVLDIAASGMLNQDFTWQVTSTSATITNPATNASLAFTLAGVGLGGTVVTRNIAFQVPGEGISVTFGRDDSQGVEVGGVASTSQWEVSILASGPTDGQLAGTMVLDTDDTGAVVIACLQGFFDDLVSSTDESLLEICSGGAPYMTFTPDPQVELANAYQALASMLTIVTGILETGIQIATAAT